MQVHIDKLFYVSANVRQLLSYTWFLCLSLHQFNIDLSFCTVLKVRSMTSPFKRERTLGKKERKKERKKDRLSFAAARPPPCWPPRAPPAPKTTIDQRDAARRPRHVSALHALAGWMVV